MRGSSEEEDRNPDRNPTLPHHPRRTRNRLRPPKTYPLRTRIQNPPPPNPTHPARAGRPLKNLLTNAKRRLTHLPAAGDRQPVTPLRLQNAAVRGPTLVPEDHHGKKPDHRPAVQTGGAAPLPADHRLPELQRTAGPHQEGADRGEVQEGTAGTGVPHFE